MKKEPAFMAGSYVNECFQLCMLLFSFVAFTHQPPLVYPEHLKKPICACLCIAKGGKGTLRNEM